MTATVTTLTPTATALTINTTEGGAFRTMLEAIGLTDTELVYSDATNLIYQRTQGTGTYADQFLRIQPTVSGLPLTVSNGWTSGTTLTGTGASQSTRFGTAGIHGYIAIKGDDNSFGLAIYLDASNVSIGFIGYIHVTPASAAISANTVPLVMGLARQTVTTNVNNNYIINGLVVNKNNQLLCSYVSSETTYGVTGTSGVYSGPGCVPLGAFNSQTTQVPTLLGYFFGTQTTLDNRKIVLPNPPIIRNLLPMGSNPNLVLTDISLLPGDNVIVEEGVEEYIVIDNSGAAFRVI